MCLLTTQIMEVEAKLDNAVTEGEIAVLEHELASLQKQFDEKNEPPIDPLAEVHALGRYIQENLK